MTILLTVITNDNGSYFLRRCFFLYHGSYYLRRCIFLYHGSYYLRRCFFPLSLPILLSDLTVYMSNRASVLQESGNYVSFTSTWTHHRFLVGSVLLIFIVFWVVLLCVFSYLVPCCNIHHNFHTKTMSVRPQLFCRRAHVIYIILYNYWLSMRSTHDRG